LTGSPATWVFSEQKGETGTVSITAYGYKFDPCPKIKNFTTGEFCAIDLFNP
jgi:hypothetical protein